MSLASVRTEVFESLSGRFNYGWVILAVASLGVFASGPGQSHTFSVFVGPISADLDLSKTEIATAYGLATLLASFLLPQVGKLVDRKGSRWVTLLIAVLLGVACILFGAVGGVITLAFGFGALRILGQGSLMLNSANLVAQWFNRRRGFAMSLMAMGFAASMAIHPPLGLWLIEQYGWRWAWVVLGFITWMILLPPFLVLIHDKPEPLGLFPDGEKQAAASERGGDVDGLSLKQSLRTNTFYLLTGSWFFISMLVTTLHFHQVSILTAQGVGADVAARVFPISALAMVLAMPLVGRLLDGVRTRFVFGGGLLILAAALFGITQVHDLQTALIYAVIFGATNAFTMTMFGYVMPRYFGRQHLGEVQGAGQLIMVIGASIGPFPVGWAFDQLGDPSTMLQSMALVPVVCAVLVIMFLRTPPGVDCPKHLE